MVARGERERRDAAGKKNRRACFVDGALGMSGVGCLNHEGTFQCSGGSGVAEACLCTARRRRKKKKRRRAARRFALSLPRVESRFAALFFPVHHDEPGTVVPVDHRVRVAVNILGSSAATSALGSGVSSAPPARRRTPRPPRRRPAAAPRPPSAPRAPCSPSRSRASYPESAPGRYPRLKHATPTPTPRGGGSERVSFFFLLVKSDDGASASLSSSTDVIAVVSSSSPTYSPTYSPSLAWLSSTSRTREAFPRRTARPRGAASTRRARLHVERQHDTRIFAVVAEHELSERRGVPPVARGGIHREVALRATARHSACAMSVVRPGGGARPRDAAAVIEAADAPTLATRRPLARGGAGPGAADRGAACAGAGDEASARRPPRGGIPRQGEAAPAPSRPAKWMRTTKGRSFQKRRANRGTPIHTHVR